MDYSIPQEIKLYHILHIDKLPQIIADQALYSDSILVKRGASGTIIGMNKIKKRRLEELVLATFSDLHVGDCVPFYFCPRSVMLYIFYKDNHPEIDYHGGQEPIIHMEADLYQVVNWAKRNGKRWVFTLSNAGARYFEDRSDLKALHLIDWNAINARDWKNCREAKQAEFLIEDEFPINLIQRIGVFSNRYLNEVNRHLTRCSIRPRVEIRTDWYY